MLAMSSLASVSGATIRVEGLRCEYLVDPLGIDETAPRLSWTLHSDGRDQRQTAYQVLVASSSERLAQDQGDLWDSGKVASDETAQVVYAGKPLGFAASVFLEGASLGPRRPAQRSGASRPGGNGLAKG